MVSQPQRACETKQQHIRVVSPCSRLSVCRAAISGLQIRVRSFPTSFLQAIPTIRRNGI
jgi:hypothetical protein